MKLHFKRIGSGNSVIILHGLYGSGSNWNSIAVKLSNDYEVILVDQRNHGHSPHLPEFNYEVLTNDLLQLFSDLNINAASIIGHSMGGKVAMNFALQHPNKVTKLVVIDIALRAYYDKSRTLSIQQMTHSKIINALSNLDIDFPETREEVDKQLARSLPQSEIRQFLLKNLKRNDDGTFYWGLNIEAIKNNLNRVMDAIDTENKTFTGPVLIVGGNKSGYISSGDVAEFYKVFPKANYQVLDTGHWVHAEQPEQLLQLLSRFL